jgi:sugar phosphate permease
MSGADHAGTSAPPAAARRFARIVPLAFITYSLAYLDRVNYGFGAAGGMAKSLGITESTSALISATFFLGYFISQIPGAAFARRRSVKTLIFWTLLGWGVFSGLTGVVTAIPLLLVVRFLLGVVEGAVMPAMLIWLTNWFSKRERSRANTLLILGNPVTLLWASILSGHLVELFGWQMMFVLEGLPSVLWAVAWWFLAKDKPEQAAWISAPEAREIEAVLHAEQEGLSPVKDYRAALRDGRVWLLGLQLFCWSLGLYGFVLWMPKIIQEGSKLGIGTTGWLNALPYLLGILLMLGASHFSDRRQERRRFVWPFLFTGAAAFYASYLFGAANFWPAFFCLILAGGCIFAGYGPFFSIVPEILPRRVAGEAMALVNSLGALGGFAGTYIVGWLNGVTGGPGASFLFLAGSLAAAGGCMLVVRTRSATA